MQKTMAPKGQLVSKSGAARRLGVPPEAIAAWVISEKIPLYPIESNVRAHGIDSEGFATLEKLASDYKLANA